MKYAITVEPDFLRAELLEHDTVAEARAFMHAVFWATVQHLRSNVLVIVSSTTPLFSDRSPGGEDLFPYIKRIAWYRTNRIALVLPEAREAGQLSGQEVESRGRQRRINLRTFGDEPSALQWFRDRRNQDRRQAEVRLNARQASERHAEHARQIPDRRHALDRRHEPRDPGRPSPALSRL
ncbi:MAG TPA: hypothetical protein VN667_03005 [Burkholderiales bacterium]|nr:hypothetical protein [Burkholderiales bacterium]